jgi:hypothetical protein
MFIALTTRKLKPEWDAFRAGWDPKGVSGFVRAIHARSVNDPDEIAFSMFDASRTTSGPGAGADAERRQRHGRPSSHGRGRLLR